MALSGGLIVIRVPNLTHIHRFLASVFDRENLEAHVMTLMDREVLLSTLEGEGLEVLYCGYRLTFRPVYRLPKAVDLISRGIQIVLHMIHLDKIPNKYGSPYLMSVSRKKGTY